MGWFGRPLEYGETELEYVLKEFNFKEGNASSEVLQHHKFGNNYILAVKYTNENIDVTYGVAVLVRHDRGYVMLKEVDETMGINIYDVPKSLIKKLSGTDNEYAKAWREKCLQYMETKYTLNKLKEGTIIELHSPTKNKLMVTRRFGKRCYVFLDRYAKMRATDIIHFGFDVIE